MPKFWDPIIFQDGTSQSTIYVLPSNVAFIDGSDLISGLFTYATPINTTYVAGPWIRGGIVAATPAVTYPDNTTATTAGIRGTVDSAGVLKSGVGFTVTATTATQKYVNFAPNPFYATPTVYATGMSPGVGNLGQISAASVGRNGFMALTANAAGTATPFGFYFIATI